MKLILKKLVLVIFVNRKYNHNILNNKAHAKGTNMNFKRKNLKTKETNHGSSLNVRLITTVIFVAVLSVTTVGTVFAEKQYTRNEILSKGRIVWSGSGGSEDAVFDSEDFITLADELDKVKGSIYSEDETVCGTWMGKTLYRKVIKTNSLPNSGAQNIPHGISNFNVVKIYGIASDSSGFTIPLPYVDTSDNSNVTLTVDNSKLTITTDANRSTFSGYVVIEYVDKK